MEVGSGCPCCQWWVDSFLVCGQVLRSIIPVGMDVPSAFEQVGHVAHVNLKAEQLPYKAVIGQVALCHGGMGSGGGGGLVSYGAGNIILQI